MKYQKDFETAGEALELLLDEFMADDYEAGVVFGGMLTTLMFRLIVSAPDTSTAIGMITSSMAAGAKLAAEYEENQETQH